MTRTDASGRPSNRQWEQAGLFAAAMAGAAAVSAIVVTLIPTPHSPQVLPLVIGLLFAAIGVGTLALSRHKHVAIAFCGILTGISIVLAAQTDAFEGSALGILALIYGLAMTFLARFDQGIGKTPPLVAREIDPPTSPIDFVYTAGRDTGNSWQFETGARDNQRTSRFLDDIIQEVKLPLNTILGFAEILQSPAARDLSENERCTYHQLLLDSCRQLTAFIADAGDIARIDADHFHLLEQDVDAAELTEIAMKFCRSAVDETDATVVVNVIENVELRCDVTSLRRVLVTLVKRAVKAGRAGSSINVAFARSQDDGLEISVLDQGPSLPPGEIERAFEPSLQERGLEGLSLPVARRIALLHGGNLTVESSRNGCRIARLTLPASRVTWKSSPKLVTTRAA